MGRDQFTREQLMVIDALVRAHSEAARELAHVTGGMKDAMIAKDSQDFEAARSAVQLARTRCEALHLAIEIARKTFQNAGGGTGLPGSG